MRSAGATPLRSVGHIGRGMRGARAGACVHGAPAKRGRGRAPPRCHVCTRVGHRRPRAGCSQGLYQVGLHLLFAVRHVGIQRPQQRHDGLHREPT